MQRTFNRGNANALGFKTYSRGASCRLGHKDIFYVKSGGCVECAKLSSKKSAPKYRLANPERHRENGRRFLGLPTPTRPCPKICECCNKPDNKRALCLDHDHLTGAFRGWLCHGCNVAIGRLGDNMEGVINAVNYLRLSHA